jgi:hypothetical protein
LYVSALLFDWLHFNAELAVLFSGIVASAFLGAIYLTPVALTIVYSLKGRIKRTVIPEIMLLGLLLTLAGTFGHGRTDIFENLTALTVIEAALSSSVLVAFTLQKIMCRRQLLRRIR